MFIINAPTDDDFRTGYKAILIYVMLAISTVCNSYLARSEIKSYLGAADNSSMNSQNVFDILAIGYTQVYNILRVIMPSQSFLTDEVFIENIIYQMMPLLHALMLFALFG